MNTVNEWISTFEFEAKLLPGLTFPARSTLIRLSDEKVLVVSPGPFDDEALTGMGADLGSLLFVAPNRFHYDYLVRAQTRFPESPIFGPDKFMRTKKGMKGIARPTAELTPLIEAEVEMIPIAGNDLLDETAFFHRASKTLVVTDLFFYMQEPMPFSRRLLLKIVRAYNKPAQSFEVKRSIKDKKAYNDTINHMVALEPETLIMAHGTILRGSQCREVLSGLIYK